MGVVLEGDWVMGFFFIGKNYTMPDLSILIPARNERFLLNTIQDILANIRGETEIICILDGAWPIDPIPDDPRVTLVYHPESIGQRAACNEAARISTSKYVMKADAHCAFDEGFDVKLMADMQDDWTVVPRLYNLHAFDWQCLKCGNRTYQGQTPAGCEKCDNTTEFEKVIVWKPRLSRKTDFMRFDSDLRFQYWGALGLRPEYQGEIAETMSLLGACFMMTRERYFSLNICDEVFGSWGQQGTEVSIKTWLSGGKLMVNKNTWYSHMFRTQAGFGFPYHLSQAQVDHARKYSQDLFFNNAWEGQIHPLSWLIEKFAPVPDWHDESGSSRLAFIKSQASSFRVILPLTNLAGSHPFIEGNRVDRVRQDMPLLTMGFESVDSRRSIRPGQVDGITDKFQMSRIAASPVAADMIQDRDVPSPSFGDRLDEPRIHDAMDQPFPAEIESSVTARVNSSCPVPAVCSFVNLDTGENSSEFPVANTVNCEIIRGTHSVSPIQTLDDIESERSSHRSDFSIIPSKGVIYYSDNRLDPAILSACQQQIKQAINGHRLTSVSLQPLAFGENIVLDRERGYLTLFHQILAGLEASTADIIFLAEHDVLYAAEHFTFTPPDPEKVYYNSHVWQVRTSDGFAVYYEAKRLSQLCAYRDILIEHYRQRVTRTQAKLDELGDGVAYRRFIREQGFEPASHGRAARVDDLQSDYWRSDVPNLDLKHGKNLTPARWKPEQFHDQRNCQGWVESDSVPGWGATARRFPEFLAEVTG